MVHFWYSGSNPTRDRGFLKIFGQIGAYAQKLRDYLFMKKGRLRTTIQDFGLGFMLQGFFAMIHAPCLMLFLRT
jgi:hypothetical protein